MKWKPRNLRELARMVVGDADHFHYRSSEYITEFFEDCELEFVHQGETRPGRGKTSNGYDLGGWWLA